MSGGAGPVPDDHVIDAVARAVHAAMCSCGSCASAATAGASPGMGTRASNAEVARAVLSVPEVAGAFADAALLASARASNNLRLPLPDLLHYLLTSQTDAQWRASRVDPDEVGDAVLALHALFDGAPADDSDIMPGSEFDGPVVL